MDTGRQGGGVRIVAIFYDLCSDIWSESPVTDSIQDGLETVESLKISVDEDIDPQRASKENNDVELGEEGDFGDEAITVVSAILVLLLVQLLVFLFSKMCHRHLHLFNHLLVEAVKKMSRG